MKPSLVPAVLDKLVVIGQTVVPANAEGEDQFEVLDGPTQDWQSLWRLLMFGWSGQPDTRGVETDLLRSGANQHSEQISVHGVVRVASGDTGLKAVRDVAYGVFDALTAAVTPRIDVKGVVKCDVTHHAIEPYSSTAGAGVEIPFTIRIEGNR